MATINSLEIGKHIDPFFIEEIPDLSQKVDFAALISSIIIGGMTFLMRSDHRISPKERLLIVNGVSESFINYQPACYMALKTKKSQPTVCGKLTYCNFKRYYGYDIRSKTIFPYVIQNLNYYDDCGRHLTSDSEPFKINGLDIIEAAFMALYDQVVKTNKVITLSEYALVYTKDTYVDPVLEIHRC